MSTAYEQALEVLEMIAGLQESRGGVFVLDEQDMTFVRKAVEALRGAADGPGNYAATFTSGSSFHNAPCSFCLTRDCNGECGGDGLMGG